MPKFKKDEVCVSIRYRDTHIFDDRIRYYVTTLRYGGSIVDYQRGKSQNIDTADALDRLQIRWEYQKRTDEWRNIVKVKRQNPSQLEVFFVTTSDKIDGVVMFAQSLTMATLGGIIAVEYQRGDRNRRREKVPT